MPIDVRFNLFCVKMLQKAELYEESLNVLLQCLTMINFTLYGSCMSVNVVVVAQLIRILVFEHKCCVFYLFSLFRSTTKFNNKRKPFSSCCVSSHANAMHRRVSGAIPREIPCKIIINLSFF